MGSKYILLATLFILASAGRQNLLMADTVQPTPRAGDAKSMAQKTAHLEKQRDWTRADWTESNVAYAKIRREMEAQFKKGVKPATLAEKYQLKGMDAYDPKKEFQWAYAAFWAQAKKPDQNKLIEISEVLDHNLKPGAYDWVRLRFLIQASQVFSRPEQLIPVGRRLLLKQPKDPEIRYGLAVILANGELKDRLNALTIVKEEIKQNPSSLRWQWQLPQTYTALWNETSQRQYNQAAVAAYKHVLTILPPDDPRRKVAVRLAVILGLSFDDKGRPQKFTPEMVKEALKNTTLK